MNSPDILAFVFRSQYSLPGLWGPRLRPLRTVLEFGEHD